MRLKLALIAILNCGILYGAPVITGTSGASGDGNTLTITGSGFGTQPHSKPAVYADFEGTNDPNSTLGQGTSWDSRDNMAFQSSVVFEGTDSLGSTSGWESTIARVRWDADLPDETKFIAAWWRRATYTVGANNNWKRYRMW